MSGKVTKYTFPDSSRLVIHAAVDNYRVRGKAYTKKLPKLVEATKMAARINQRASSVEEALQSLLVAVYQLDYIPNVPDDYCAYNDEEMEEIFI